MEAISVRLLVTRNGAQDTDVIETTVLPGEALQEVESRLTLASPADDQVKWIYMGRRLTETLPGSLQPASTLHVVVNRRPIESSTGSPRGSKELNYTSLLIIHSIFTACLGFAWYGMYFGQSHLYNPISSSVVYILSFISVVTFLQIIRGKLSQT